MKKLISGLFVVVFVLIVLFALLQIVNADEIVTLDWFTVNSYTLESGEVRANFDFYYFEDNDPNSYLGSMSMAYDCNGNFEIDEMVDKSFVEIDVKIQREVVPILPKILLV